MKALAAALLLLALSAGAASASRHPSLRVVTLSPPTFRGSGFKPHEPVTVSVRGLPIHPVHVLANARGRFRVRLVAISTSTWAVRAVGAHGGTAVYRHTSHSSIAETDVEGVVQRGPLTPICTASTPCTGPAVGVTVQALQAGKPVAQTTTDHNGHFTFSLAPGDYTIQALGRGTEPKAVHVTTSTRVHLAFLIDTGIR